jgi:hypothetical protein
MGGTTRATTADKRLTNTLVKNAIDATGDVERL